MGGELLAGFALEDPPRPEAAQVIGTLRSMGVKRVIMLTGDLDGMAERMARELGITEWVAQALPLLRSLATATLSRVQGNFGFIVGANSLLLLGGLFGVTSPALGAFLHNAATVAVAANALRPYSLPSITSGGSR